MNNKKVEKYLNKNISHGTINWKEIETMPQQKGDYLISDGKRVEIATLSYWNSNTELEWFLPERSDVNEDNITHWAKINFPD